MLTMDDIKYIRRMYEKEGCSIREIMKRTGYHYETVSKYLDMEDFNLPIPLRMSGRFAYEIDLLATVIEHKKISPSW